MSQTFTDDCFASAHVAQTDMANIEDNFAALKSCFSGSSAPSNAVAGMWWYDTSANILKLRDEANSAWQSVWDFANNKPVITNLSNEITGAMISSAIKDAAAGTASLRTLGTSSTSACAGNDSRLMGVGSFSAGDVPVFFSDEEVSRTGGTPYTYYCIKRVRISRGGTLRVKFDGKYASVAGDARVYRNSVAVGTNRSLTTSYVTYSQDISGWSAGDYVEVWTTGDNTGSVQYVENFRLYAAATFTEAMDLTADI